MAGLDPKDIESILELFNKSDWDEMHLKTDELEIFLSNDPAATGPSSAGAAPQPDAIASTTRTVDATVTAPASTGATAIVRAVPDGMVAVSAPNLGTFYRAPKPGAAPYVEVGQEVAADTEVCLIEVMKLFTPVSAGTAGVIHEICIDDGQMIEFGQILVVIDPQK